jgi:hypothetical protein
VPLVCVDDPNTTARKVDAQGEEEGAGRTSRGEEGATGDGKGRVDGLDGEEGTALDCKGKRQQEKKKEEEDQAKDEPTVFRVAPHAVTEGKVSPTSGSQGMSISRRR